MNSLILSFLAFASTLAPTSASDYKYCVPPVECWPLVDGTGMGDTVSYRAIRYTDIAWLANAVHEFGKLRKDIFKNPRHYTPYYQVTNTLMFRLTNPSGIILRPQAEDYVNYGMSASSAIPNFLDADKILSASVALPVGYGGDMQVAWPLIADVTASNRWRLSDRLFAALATNATSQIVRLSTITNAYDSIKKLHSLKFVYGAANTLNNSSGTTADGRETTQNYIGHTTPTKTVVWDPDLSATNAWTSSSIPLGGVGGFDFIAYAYDSKWYNYKTENTNGLSRSSLCWTEKIFNFYPTFNANTSTPCTVAMNSCISKVYSVENREIGYDAAWSDRRGDFERVSCFSIREEYKERKAATGPSDGEFLSSSTTEYVLVDTSGWIYRSVGMNSQYIGRYAIIGCGFFDLTTLVSFFESILGPDRKAKLDRGCDAPRVAENNGYGEADYSDHPYREVAYKVSHVWSISTLKPNYTCTFDGN